MDLDTALTLGVLLVTMALLAFEVLAPDVLLLAALAALLAAGVIDLEAALSGFSNSTLLAIGSLYVIAAGLRETGVLDRVGEVLLGGVRSLRRLLARQSVAVAATSAFLNNTPIVAMGVPAIRAWAHREGVPASKLLMPLSFASILGGLCTLIGTSTNLVTDGLLRSHGLEGLGFFELAGVGVPCAVAGILYLVLVSPRVLRTREDVRRVEEREQAGLVELELTEGSPLVGRSVREAGLEGLPGLRLVRVARGDREIGPVGPDEELAAGDRLFYELAETIPEGEDPGRPSLETYPGLRLAMAETVRDREGGPELHEAVVREGSGLVGFRVGEVGFLERFGAAVTGVRRGGERVERPLADIRLRAGDTLMLDTGRGFRDAHGDAGDFFVATEAPEEDRPAGRAVRRARRRAMATAVAILVGVVLLTVLGVFHIAVAALLGAIAVVASGLLAPGEARQAVDWSVLLVIGTAFGIASAMESSGAARLIGEGIVGVSSGFGAVGVLAGVIVATMLLTGLITNNAAAALMFPIALSVARTQALDPRPLLVGITIAASLALWTPLGYQTNLMVYGPGNYRFLDFTRLGLPLQIVLAAIATVAIPIVWPF